MANTHSAAAIAVPRRRATARKDESERTQRDRDDLVRRAEFTPQELLIGDGVAADVEDLARQAADHGRPTTLRDLAKGAGVSHSSIDKYMRGARRISMVGYTKLLAYLFDRLPARVRRNHPAGKLILDPVIAAMLNSGLSDATTLFSVLATMKALHDAAPEHFPGGLPGARLYDYLTKRGEDNPQTY